MKILAVHNAYQHRGGEDAVVESEVALLRSKGHIVEAYFRSNDEIKNGGSARIALNAIWSSKTTADFQKKISSFRPDVVHVHNTFPLISPSLYWAAHGDSIPLVQTLHNFRLMCLNALFLRDSAVCEDCMGRIPWRGVLHGCYRGSRSLSAALATSLTVHRALRTYQSRVSRYIALNEFCRGKFIEGGLPPERVVVKPNFVEWDAHDVDRRNEKGAGKGFLYVGRLSQEKGISVLVEAMSGNAGISLRVAGDGPEKHLFSDSPQVSLLGSLPESGVRAELSRAVALVIPSIWYENFPRTIVEAFASGVPVIGSNIGAIAGLIRDGETGLLFEAGNAADLSRKLEWAVSHPAQMSKMGSNARNQYLMEYSSEANYKMLIQIYETAIAEPR